MILYANPYGPFVPAPQGWQTAIAKVLSRRRLALSGLTGACPDFAPYEVNGRCSNIPPGLDAHEYFTSGGALDESGVVTEEAAAQYHLAQQQALVPSGPSPAYLAVAEKTREAAQRKADEAARAGVACEVVQNCSPVVVGGSPGSETECLYWLDCRFPDGYRGTYDPRAGRGAGSGTSASGSTPTPPAGVVPTWRLEGGASASSSPPSPASSDFDLRAVVSGFPWWAWLAVAGVGLVVFRGGGR